MSKGLEALWEYRLLVANYEDKWSKNTTEHFVKCADIIEKELKALEIIKIHGVDVYCLKHTNKLIEYNTRNAYVDSITLLSQEQFDLLKEVLL